MLVSIKAMANVMDIRSCLSGIQFYSFWKSNFHFPLGNDPFPFSPWD